MGNLPSQEHFDVIIVGGGFFGLSIAQHLATRKSLKILILEKENDVMQRASTMNQARVHGGYHYPHSLLTATRSRANFQRFIAEHETAIQSSLNSYYAIAKKQSSLSPSQFQAFCSRIGAPLELAPRSIKKEFDPSMISEVFQVEECAFDASQIRKKLTGTLIQTGVTTLCGVEALEIHHSNQVLVKTNKGNFSSDSIFLANYSGANHLLKASGLDSLPVRKELAEIALFKTDDSLLKSLSITVMSGPFFSLMPYPTRQLMSLSHVRYTPQTKWSENETENNSKYAYSSQYPARSSNQALMLRDACRFFPRMKALEYVDSFFEIKTLMPVNDFDDGRPILFHRQQKCPNIISVIGGKIDNVYDVYERLDELYN